MFEAIVKEKTVLEIKRNGQVIVHKDLDEFSDIEVLSYLLEVMDGEEKADMVEKLTDVAEYMARQYLTDVDDNIMTHDFMITGEMCLSILLELGKIETDDGIHYTWTEELTCGS